MIKIDEKYLTFENGYVFADFELDAYAQLDVEVELDAPADLDLALGEVAINGRVEREPGGYRITFTISPTESTSVGCLTNLFEICDICTRPS